MDTTNTIKTILLSAWLSSITVAHVNSVDVPKTSTPSVTESMIAQLPTARLRNGVTYYAQQIGLVSAALCQSTDPNSLTKETGEQDSTAASKLGLTLDGYRILDDQIEFVFDLLPKLIASYEAYLAQNPSNAQRAQEPIEQIENFINVLLNPPINLSRAQKISATDHGSIAFFEDKEIHTIIIQFDQVSISILRSATEADDTNKDKISWHFSFQGQSGAPQEIFLDLAERNVTFKFFSSSPNVGLTFGAVLTTGLKAPSLSISTSLLNKGTPTSNPLRGKLH